MKKNLLKLIQNMKRVQLQIVPKLKINIKNNFLFNKRIFYNISPNYRSLMYDKLIK